MIKINVILKNKSWKKYLKNPINFIDKKISLINKKNKLYKRNILICSLLLAGTSDIKKLNKKFRNKSKSTDVLSFPSEKKFSIKKNTYLGDIVVSYEFMNKPKALSKLEFRNNVAKVFIHSFLHLLGYDHIKMKDFKKMLVEEEKIYKLVKSKNEKFA